jgi:DNA-binding beta-propeller fold protein YncE
MMNQQFMALTVLFLHLLIATATFGQKASGKPPVQETVLRADLMAIDTPFDKIRRVLLGPDGNSYVLDSGNHRVVVLSPKLAFVRQISEVGQGPGELFVPIDFALDRAGNVYIIDSKKRVQWFSPQGKFLGGFRFEGECLAMAVNGRREILLSQPGLGALVAVYDTGGNHRRSFGSLKPAGDPHYQAVANRVHLHVARDDNVYVSFDHQGLLQKYDADGQMLWEAKIPGEQVERMRRTFWSDEPDKSKQGIVLTTAESGISAFYVAFNIFFDESRRRLYVPLNDGSIYVADAAGKPMQLMKQPTGSINFYKSIAVDSQGRLLATGYWKGLYLIYPGRPA